MGMSADKLPATLTRLKSHAIILDPEVIDIIVSLHAYFDDYKKIMLWLKTKNPQFGFVAPLRLIQLGKAKRILNYIEAVKEGNLP